MPAGGSRPKRNGGNPAPRTNGQNHNGVGMAVRVIVRKRPVQEGERDCLTVASPNVLVAEDKVKVDLTKYVHEQTFTFDDSFGEHDDTQAVFERSVVDLVSNVFGGGTSTAFCFGQTASGKTFTLFGEGGGLSFHSPLLGGDDQSEARSEAARGGLYLLVATDLFARLEDDEFGGGGGGGGGDDELDDLGEYLAPTVNLSMYEIKGQRLYDLLNNKEELRALEDERGVLQLVGLTQHECPSLEDFIAVSNAGRTARTTASTGANDTSSRSHCAMLIRIMRGDRLVGKLSLIDLAGSERGVDNDNTDKLTRMEGRQINTSLLALKEVIRAMQSGKHAPFRQSKLTQVLEESLTGEHCRTVVIACVSGAEENVQHTINTLRYGSDLRPVGTKPTKAERRTSAVVRPEHRGDGGSRSEGRGGQAQRSRRWSADSVLAPPAAAAAAVASSAVAAPPSRGSPRHRPGVLRRGATEQPSHHGMTEHLQQGSGGGSGGRVLLLDDHEGLTGDGSGGTLDALDLDCDGDDDLTLDSDVRGPPLAEKRGSRRGSIRLPEGPGGRGGGGAEECDEQDHSKMYDEMLQAHYAQNAPPQPPASATAAAPDKGHHHHHSTFSSSLFKSFGGSRPRRGHGQSASADDVALQERRGASESRVGTRHRGGLHGLHSGGGKGPQQRPRSPAPVPRTAAASAAAAAAAAAASTAAPGGAVDLDHVSPTSCDAPSRESSMLKSLLSSDSMVAPLDYSLYDPQSGPSPHRDHRGGHRAGGPPLSPLPEGRLGRLPGVGRGGVGHGGVWGGGVGDGGVGGGGVGGGGVGGGGGVTGDSIDADYGAAIGIGRASSEQLLLAASARGVAASGGATPPPEDGSLPAVVIEKFGSKSALLMIRFLSDQVQ